MQFIGHIFVAESFLPRSLSHADEATAHNTSTHARKPWNRTLSWIGQSRSFKVILIGVRIHPKGFWRDAQ